MNAYTVPPIAAIDSVNLAKAVAILGEVDMNSANVRIKLGIPFSPKTKLTNELSASNTREDIHVYTCKTYIFLWSNDYACCILPTVGAFLFFGKALSLY